MVVYICNFWMYNKVSEVRYTVEIKSNKPLGPMHNESLLARSKVCAAQSI